MHYEGVVYRPPSEAYSLILQLTVGCSHNACTFCDMYKDKRFRIRPWEEFAEDINTAKKYHRDTRKIFLADGNCLTVDTAYLLRVLKSLRENFSDLERIAAYAGPKDVLGKSDVELADLRDAGLGILYLGVETGSDLLLKAVRKGVTAAEMVEAGQKIKKAGIKLSVTVISGLGGKESWQEHALETAKVINAIDPDYLGLLTLMLRPGTPLYRKYEKGEFVPLDAKQVMQETLLMLENLNLTRCIFRSNHISNYVSLAGTLPQDKERLLRTVREVLEKNDGHFYRPENLRHL